MNTKYIFMEYKTGGRINVTLPCIPRAPPLLFSHPPQFPVFIMPQFPI